MDALRTADIAAAAGISERSVRRALAEGRLPSVRSGRGRVVRPEHVEAFVGARRIVPLKGGGRKGFKGVPRG